MLQNPSHGLAPQLTDHVHLVSSHRYPISASLNLDQAFRYLLDAPQIVKQIASMSWTYVQAPPDGTLWLEWLSQDRGDNFPSDGYVWADQEQQYRQEYNGYTIEMMVHQIGFRPSHDSMASHARTRYHFVAKNPSVNAANPDAALWIVHYHQTDPGRMLPSNQIPISPQVTQIMAARRWLESQGKLERKDFMLHDRMSWPTINVPSGGYMGQQGVYGAQPTRHPSNTYPQGPPSKKMKTQHSAGAGDAAHDTTIEDEENTALGDFFDHLTPRDISLARYTQHHRWMEEVFSSPYASSQIVPTDLGLGLMGELKGLTDGILEPPSMDFAERHIDRASRTKEPQPFTNLSHDQLEEFNKRVSKHLEDGQAKIERMKAEHAAKMDVWKKTKTLMQAEKQLRDAIWEEYEAAEPVYRLDDAARDPEAKDGGSKVTVESVVRDVEEKLGTKISSHDEANMVAAGGLEKEEEQPRDQMIHSNGGDGIQLPSTQLQEQPSTAGEGHNATQPREQQPQYRLPEAGTNVTTQQPNLTASSEVRHPSMQPVSQDQQSIPVPPHEQQNAQQVDGNDVASMAVDDTSMMEGMDIDINDSNIEFDDSELNTGLNETTGVIENPTQPAVTASEEQTSTPSIPAPSVNALGAGHDETSQQPQGSSVVEPTIVAPESGVATSTLPATDGRQANEGMFNDSTFDDFTNMGDAGEGDGLIDFEAGSIGMDDSAFGEALHGMEQPEGGDGTGEGA